MSLDLVDQATQHAVRLVEEGAEGIQFSLVETREGIGLNIMTGLCEHDDHRIKAFAAMGALASEHQPAEIAVVIQGDFRARDEADERVAHPLDDPATTPALLVFAQARGEPPRAFALRYDVQPWLYSGKSVTWGEREEIDPHDHPDHLYVHAFWIASDPCEWPKQVMGERELLRIGRN